MKKVVIIGAGIGGLATANLLAAGGYNVTMYEKNGAAGGRAGSLQLGGFRFDTGPSWYLMPEVFEHYFKLLGKDIRDYLQLERLDPAYKVFYENQAEPLTIHADLARDRQTFDAIEPGAGDKLESYLDQAATTYQAALDNFLYTNFERKASLLNLKVLEQLPWLAINAAMPIERYVGRYFSDARLKKIMEYPMVFLGTSPYEAPAIYSLMSHLDFKQGVYYPQGGMYTIIEALLKIGAELGVEYHYNSPVAYIETQAGRSTGIRLENDESIEADIIISNADLHFTETQLLAPADRTYDQAYWDKKQVGPSALLMYLGIEGELPELTHHNLLFADDWQANFGAIFKNKTWPQPASIYICKPSQTDASVAPAGHENLFVLVPAPAATGVDDDRLNQLADDYLDQIADMTGVTDLKQRIVVKQLVGPDDFAANFNSWQGTALGLSHKLNQSALFRPANRSKKISNLYYVGGNSAPGVGLPMCLIGAELLYKRFSGDKTNHPLLQLGELHDV